MKYDMSNEPKPKLRKLLPKGWRQFTIIACKEAKSKGGNDMFIFTIVDRETGYEEDIYAVATQGKRWFLKSILTAVGCVGGADGCYEWEIEDVINQTFMGLVEHEPNSYINREGITVDTVQHRITDVKEVEEVEWDADKK